MRKLAFGLLLGMTCVFVACQSNKLKVDVSDIKLEIKIERFEQKLFDLKNGSSLEDLKSEYPRILRLYSEKVIGLGHVDDLNYLQYLNKFLNDSTMNLVANRIDSIFPDLDQQESELTGGFKHLKYYYPKAEIPKIFSQISGFNQSVVVDEGLIGVSLDKYLGVDCDFYALLRRPVYLRENMVPIRIAQDILLAYGLTEFPFRPKAHNLMEQMIYQGKILYFLQALLPEKSESDIVKYSSEDYKWCVDNETQVWAYLIEQKHLFSTQTSMTRNYINDAPFTTGMPQESPGRIGTWVGLQIVKSYMAKHSELSIPQLMAEDDYAAILRESAYQP
ncbi:gliding motility lipoprotein GldB [Ancylomarina euxinus]|uniref:Gliding motility lipoprotein GldB n=1 Tax=Ancylomarina euxinus TaxID=2283627 RepID=A0A425Y4Z6_9BACT|nr:gliding motility lipoprotein GldB [Ancylomarina euxinus]MCZ4694418.1 gliding motility lipoprotein GldB [Ancylomarina euxinus]MUP14252.1 gliding motility lipoprotein GldB [Ancylomarina euxinus]RRG23573.1 gliding motility lipoprotein GldB [Ancylomarina euxinus]